MGKITVGSHGVRMTPTPIDYADEAKKKGADLRNKSFWLQALYAVLYEHFAGQLMSKQTEKAINDELQNWYNQMMEYNAPRDFTGKQINYDWSDVEQPAKIVWDSEHNNVNLEMDPSLSLWLYETPTKMTYQLI